MNGGGVSNSGTATLTACTISGNIASVAGGGFYNHDFLDQPGCGDIDRHDRRRQHRHRRRRQRHRRRGGRQRHRLVQPDRHRRLGRDPGRRAGQHRPGQPRRAGPGPAGRLRRADPDHRPPARQPRPRRRHRRPGSRPTSAASPSTSRPTSAPSRARDSSSPRHPAPPRSPTPTGEAFANPLVVTVVARNPVEPVVGGIVSFTVTPDGDSGAEAELSALSRDHRGRPSGPGHGHGQRPHRDLHRHGVDRRRPHSARIILTNLPNNQVRPELLGADRSEPHLRHRDGDVHRRHWPMASRCRLRERPWRSRSAA